MISIFGTLAIAILSPFEQNDWDVLKTLKWSSNEFKKNIFLFETKAWTGPNTAVGFSLTDIAYCLVPSSIYMGYYIVAVVRVTSFFHPAVTLNAAVNAFMKEVMVDDFEEVSKNNLHEHYAQLKLLNRSINEVWGLTNFFILMDHVLWLATDLTVGFKETGVVARLHMICFCLGVIVLAIIASEISRKVFNFKEK